MVFGIPGLILLVSGPVGFERSTSGPVTVMSVTFDYHTLLYSTAAILLGYQSLLLFIFAKLMAVETGLHPPRTRFWFLQQRSTLERCTIIGFMLIIIGVVFDYLRHEWSLAGFDDCDQPIPFE